MKDSRLAGIHSLTRSARIKKLQESGWVSDADLAGLKAGGFDVQLLQTMSENMVSFMALPVGVVPNVVVNGVTRLVPMATEEPSVIAACSKAAKLAAQGGGVTACAGERRIGALVLISTDASDEDIVELLRVHKELFMDQGASYHPRLVAAGGRVEDISFRRLESGSPKSVVFDITCNPADAMGANFANDIAERWARFLAYMLPCELQGAIVTNQPLGRPAMASVKVPFEALATNGEEGASVAAKIEALCHWARHDPLRCVTHVKGILNGVFAVMTPLYQDVRAQAVAVSAFCSSQGAASLCQWSVQEGRLVGNLAMPMVCGTAGGTGPHVGTTSTYYRWMKVERAGELEEVLAAVGLLQNLGALLAIATEGIQKGHMKLHERKQER